MSCYAFPCCFVLDSEKMTPQLRIEVDSKLLGDPIEVAALRGIGWSYQPSSSTASPSNWRAKEITIARQKEYMGNLKDDIESDKKEKEEISKKIADLEKSLGGLPWSKVHFPWALVRSAVMTAQEPEAGQARSEQAVCGDQASLPLLL